MTRLAPRALALAITLCCTSARTETGATGIDALRALEPQLIAWRRDLHQHPELGNRETRTAALVARELRGFGIEVREGIALTGVLGVLRGDLPGPTIALRADMDALPVTEPTGLSFASTVRTRYRDVDTGVMHACGHDAHVAILLATARQLAAERAKVRGTVLFVFQPAEEGPPDGETGGAPRMLEEGVFREHTPAAIFGLHVASHLHVGEIGVRSGPTMAAYDTFEVVVRGRQTHGGRPWQGVDPITVASQVVIGANTIISRQTDLAAAPAVLTFGAINGGLRENIIPDEVRLLGSIRSFTPHQRADIASRLQRTAQSIAESAGAEADVRITTGMPVLVNDPQLSARATAALRSVFGERMHELSYVTSSEDFAYYAERVPGFFFRLGITSPEIDAASAPTNHSPQFMIDERGLIHGVQAFLTLVAMMGEATSVTPSN
jgi:amidohydrolase